MKIKVVITIIITISKIVLIVTVILIHVLMRCRRAIGEDVDK